MIPWLELIPHGPGAADAFTGGTHDARWSFADIDGRRGERRKQVLTELHGSLRELTKLLELHGDHAPSAAREELLEKTEERAIELQFPCEHLKALALGSAGKISDVAKVDRPRHQPV